jgi:hypothetical protein
VVRGTPLEEQLLRVKVNFLDKEVLNKALNLAESGQGILNNLIDSHERRTLRCYAGVVEVTVDTIGGGYFLFERVISVVELPQYVIIEQGAFEDTNSVQGRDRLTCDIIVPSAVVTGGIITCPKCEVALTLILLHH